MSPFLTVASGPRAPAVEGGGSVGILSLVITFADDSTLAFDQAAATDVGDYVGPYVHQKCYKQRSGDWTVFFRPDADGLRHEVVVELGSIDGGTAIHYREEDTPDVVPYSAAIYLGGVLQDTVTVDYHWWWGRWRWQSAPRPFVRTTAALMASNHLLPYTPHYLYGYAGWSTDYTYEIMGLAGMSPGMAGVGDRNEIGPLTMPQSAYILDNTNALAKSSMLAQAEASASLPIHIRDEVTGCLLDVQDRPYMAVSGIGGAEFEIPSPDQPLMSEAFDDYDQRFMRMDTAHTPSLCYLPYLLTDDPYYLEEHQFMALWHIIQFNYHQSNFELPGLVNPNETRAYGWGVRSVGTAAYATPASVPGWLNSKAYWETNLADNLTFVERYMASPARVHTVFHAFTRADSQQGFMLDYTCMALSWIVRMGYTDWQAAYEWVLGGLLPFVTEGSGWPRGWPDPYYMGFCLDDGHATVLLVPDTSVDAEYFATWALAWQRWCTNAGWAADPTLDSCPSPTWDNESIMQTQSTSGYFLYRQAALHLAVEMGITAAEEPGEWIDAQMPAVIAAHVDTHDPRHSFSNGTIPPTYIAQSRKNDVAGTSVSVMLPNVQPGNTLVMAGFCYGATAAMSVSDDTDNDWIEQEEDLTHPKILLAYALDVVGGDTVVTFNPGATFCGIAVAEVFGLKTAAALDDSSKNTGTSTTPTTGNIVATGPGIVFGAVAVNAGGAITPASGWTTLQEQETFANICYSMVYKLTTAGTHNPDWTISNVAWNAAGLALLDV